MQILAIDNEKLLLEYLVCAIKEVEPEAEILKFSRTSTALEQIEQNSLRPDVAFLDIEMPGMTGLELAKCIKDISPNTNIIFVTGYSQYAVEAAKLHFSGYILKPAEPRRIREELDNLRYPVKEEKTKRIFVQTFGNFEVFADQKPVEFLRSKSKEIFAYLVDKRGTGAGTAEIAAALWEDGYYDRSRQKQLQVYISDLKKSLKAVNAEDILVKNKRGIMVDKTKFDCDMYRFLEGDVSAINTYTGQYMSSYSWAELTVAFLDGRK